MGFRGRFSFIDHHLAHAASAFFVSPHQSAAVVTVDLCGEDCTTLIARGDGATVTPIRRFYLPDSIGLFYAALTQFLGYRANSDEYKVMGLAPYGQPRFEDTFAAMIQVRDGRLRADNSWFAYHLGGETCYSRRFVEAFGAPCPGEERVGGPPYPDVASSGQRALERVLADLVEWACAAAASDTLCLAGGVALNSVAAGRLREHGGFRHVWVQPAASDAGCALGIPFYIWHQRLGQPRTFTLEHAYWGPAFGDDRMQRAIVAGGLRAERVADVERRAAHLLADGAVLGWFQGRMEWGPRALGNRSILADPRRAGMKDLINAKIKFREPYRPFAPSVLEEHVGEFFDFEGPSPFMSFVCRVREERKASIPAVTHVDGTARLQTVSRAANLRYWTLLREFHALSGVPVLLNTSFNVKGEPIVCTPEDAVRCFLTTDLDYLVMGDTICSRLR
jgi:carbamoyltransferase